MAWSWSTVDLNHVENILLSHYAQANEEIVFKYSWTVWSHIEWKNISIKNLQVCPQDLKHLRKSKRKSIPYKVNLLLCLNLDNFLINYWLVTRKSLMFCNFGFDTYFCPGVHFCSVMTNQCGIADAERWVAWWSSAPQTIYLLMGTFRVREHVATGCRTCLCTTESQQGTRVPRLRDSRVVTPFCR